MMQSTASAGVPSADPGSGALLQETDLAYEAGVAV
jgi:hypothetical protein